MSSRDKMNFNGETRGFPTLIDIFVIQMKWTPTPCEHPWDRGSTREVNKWPGNDELAG